MLHQRVDGAPPLTKPAPLLSRAMLVTWRIISGTGGSSGWRASSQFVPAVVRATNEPAIGAVLDVSGQRWRAACRDRRHHAACDSAEMGAVITPIGRAAVAEDIRHLRLGTHGWYH
jgi:hypothetical protein